MKVLILTGSTGGGHNSAARNIKKSLEENGIESLIYDIGTTKDGDVSGVVKVYENVVKHTPIVYRYIYNMTNNQIASEMNRFVRNNSESLYNFLQEYKPNVIISSHPVAVQLVKRFIRKGYDFNIPYIQLVTDFKAHYVYLEEFVTAYVTGSEYTSFSVSEKGKIPFNRTFDFGIPVDDKFYIKDYKKEENSNSIMIMLGSLGFINEMDNIFDLLDRDKSRKYYFVTGLNEELKFELEEKYSKKIEEGKLEVLGFINNVDEIMKKSDIIITKPGGITISECINLRKPMIFVTPLPGQEEENIEVMKLYGIGYDATNSNLYDIVESIYSSPNNMSKMLDGLEKISENYGKQKIVNLIKEIYEKNKNR